VVHTKSTSQDERRKAQKHKGNLEEALRGRHGSLNGKASDVLPALLQQGDQVIDGQHDVGDQLFLLHSDIPDGDTHTENLLELELNGRLNLVDLAS